MVYIFFFFAGFRVTVISLPVGFALLLTVLQLCFCISIWMEMFFITVCLDWIFFFFRTKVD